MRVLVEYNGRRVDIKEPVSNRAGRPDDPSDLQRAISQALEVVSVKAMPTANNNDK